MRRKFLAAAAMAGLVSLTSKAMGGASPGMGNQMVLLTYWGDDEIALVDINGVPGKETIFNLNVLKNGCSKPYDIKVNAARSVAYATCSGSDKIILIDLVSQLVSGEIRVGEGPRDIALMRDGKTAVVANSGEDTVAVVDLQSREVKYKIPVRLQPYGVALTEDGRLAAVTTWASGDVHFISLGERGGSDLGSVAVGPLPYTVTIPPKSPVAYVTVNSMHKIVTVDIATRKVVGEIPVGRNPWGAAPSPDGKTLLIANNRSADVSILRLGGSHDLVMAEAKRVPVNLAAGPIQATRSKPKNSSISLNGKLGAVTDLGNNELLIIDLEQGRQLKRIPVGKAPYGVEFLR